MIHQMIPVFLSFMLAFVGFTFTSKKLLSPPLKIEEAYLNPEPHASDMVSWSTLCPGSPTRVGQVQQVRHLRVDPGTDY